MIQPWVTLREVELRPERVDDKSAGARRRIQEAERGTLDRALESTSERRTLVLLDEGGKSLTTQQWAELLRDHQDRSTPDVCFCIGSSLGFAPETRSRAQRILSLGPQTLPHELARVVLLEQLYRAMSVVRGHPYHNEGS